MADATADAAVRPIRHRARCPGCQYQHPINADSFGVWSILDHNAPRLVPSLKDHSLCPGSGAVVPAPRATHLMKGHTMLFDHKPTFVPVASGWLVQHPKHGLGQLLGWLTHQEADGRWRVSPATLGYDGSILPFDDANITVMFDPYREVTMTRHGVADCETCGAAWDPALSACPGHLGKDGCGRCRLCLETDWCTRCPDCGVPFRCGECEGCDRRALQAAGCMTDAEALRAFQASLDDVDGDGDGDGGDGDGDRDN